MTRLRLRIADSPRPALVLGDTPRPYCGGVGMYEDGQPDPDYPDLHMCGCWNPLRSWRLLPLPKWAARLLGWRAPTYSKEPPF